MEIRFVFHSAEPRAADYGGMPEEAEVEKVLMNGDDITKRVGREWIKRQQELIEEAKHG